ncbi:MAG: hypothetical protein KDD58_03370 [Bdellovibrionales bacterium]|nr:hypothetical protein [Bdellovibrionales bacterium]
MMKPTTSKILQHTSYFLIGISFLCLGGSTHFVYKYYFNQATINELFAAFTFLGLALAIFAIFWFQIKPHALLPEKIKMYPNEPWRWRRCWQQGQITPLNYYSPSYNITMGVVMLLLPGPLYPIVFTEFNTEKEFFLYLFLIFPFIGIIAIMNGLKHSLRSIKYGSGVIAYNKPGIIGGFLKAQLIVQNKKAWPKDEVYLQLVCLKFETKKMNGKYRSYRSISWKADHKVKLQKQMGFTKVLIEVPIPFECQPTTFDSENEQYEWEMTVKTPEDGSIYEEKFLVPVFKTAQSNPDFIENSILEQSQEISSPKNKQLRTSLPFETLQDRSKKYVFHSATTKIFSYVFIILGLVLCGVFAKESFQNFSTMNGFFDFVFAVFPAIASLLAFAFFILGLALNRLKIYTLVDDKNIVVVYNFIMWKLKRTLSLNEIKKYEIKITSQANDRVWYDIVLFGENKKLSIPCQLTSKLEAKAFADELISKKTS